MSQRPAPSWGAPQGRPTGLLCLITLLASLSCGNPMPSYPEEERTGTTTPERTEASPLEPEPVAVEDRKFHPVTIYYNHPYLRGMVPHTRQIFENPDAANLVKQMIDLLTIPPEDGNGTPIWPDNTHVREVYPLEDGTLVIDFDKKFTESLAVNIIEEELMVYSLINSALESFPQFDKVRILIHGKTWETFLGHIDIEFPLTRRYTLYNIIPEPPLSDEILVEELEKDPKRAEQL